MWTRDGHLISFERSTERGKSRGGVGLAFQEFEVLKVYIKWGGELVSGELFRSWESSFVEDRAGGKREVGLGLCLRWKDAQGLVNELFLQAGLGGRSGWFGVCGTVSRLEH